MGSETPTERASAPEARELDSTADTVLELVRQATKVEDAYITRIDPENHRELFLFASSAYEPLVQAGEAIDWEDTVCSRALASDDWMITDIREHWPDCGVAQWRGIRTYFGAPIYTADGELFGILLALSRHAVTPPDDDVQPFLERCASLVAKAVDQERRNRDREVRASHAEELADEMTFLHRIGELCLNTTDLPGAINEFARLTNRRGDWERVTAFYQSDGRWQPTSPTDGPVVDHLDAVIHSRISDHLDAPDGIHGQTIQLDANRWAVSELRATAGLPDGGATMLIPIMSSGGMQGGIILFHSHEMVMSAGQTRLMTNCADYLSLLADRIEYVDELWAAKEELAHIATEDALTGLKNRRYLMEELGRILAQARRLGELIHIAFIDLDGFKAINDTYGHDAGDEFLTQFAERLKLTTRTSDLVARYGGDEFVVVAPGTASRDPSYEQRRLSERLAEATSGRYPLAIGEIDYAGPSVGIASTDEGVFDADILLTRADAAMYNVKQSRRSTGRRS